MAQGNRKTVKSPRTREFAVWPCLPEMPETTPRKS